MSKPRAILDTNVLIATFRSRAGASFEIFRRLRCEERTAVLSNHLIYEYEEVLKREAAALFLNLNDVDQILNAVSARGEEWPLSHNWEPILQDPDDDPLVQLAQESGALIIITHNTRHLQPAVALGIPNIEAGGIFGYIKEVKMSTLEIKIPDLLLRQVSEISISSRAKRVDWRAVDDILARVPEAPPKSGDTLN